MTQKCLNKLKLKVWCNKPTKLQFSNNFNTENFDALKRNESTEVDRRTWLHVPSGTLSSTSSETRQVVEILKETCT